MLRQRPRAARCRTRPQAQAKLDKAIIDVLAVAEAYPDLKASANFQSLQAELADTENKISFARQYYNDAVAKLNSLVRTIPWLLFTGIAGVHAARVLRRTRGPADPTHRHLLTLTNRGTRTRTGSEATYPHGAASP